MTLEQILQQVLAGLQKLADNPDYRERTYCSIGAIRFLIEELAGFTRITEEEQELLKQVETTWRATLWPEEGE